MKGISIVKKYKQENNNEEQPILTIFIFVLGHYYKGTRVGE